jgi:hypothetical protein
LVLLRAERKIKFMKNRKGDIAANLHQVVSDLRKEEKNEQEAQRKKEQKRKKKLADFRNMEAAVIVPALKEIVKELRHSGFDCSLKKDDDELEPGHIINISIKKPPMEFECMVFLAQEERCIYALAIIRTDENEYESKSKRIPMNCTSAEVEGAVRSAINQVLAKIIKK